MGLLMHARFHRLANKRWTCRPGGWLGCETEGNHLIIGAAAVELSEIRVCAVSQRRLVRPFVSAESNNLGGDRL